MEAGLIVAGVIAVLFLIVLFSSFFTVEQQTSAVVERFGKFSRVAGPGLNLKIPIAERNAGSINLRVQQLDVTVETKTLDNVFVHTVVAVQFMVVPDKVYDAFYRLDRPTVQITAYVFDVVRARVPKMELDDLFDRKDEIAIAVKQELSAEMDSFGYLIVQALVTDIDPDKKVKESMNEINAAKRLRVAATERGEADKILKVKAAEAEAESKALQGKGIADQRRAIIDGLRESVDQFAQSISGTTPESIMQLVLMTQHYDTVKEIGASSRSNTIFMPYSPGGMSDLAGQMREALIGANAATAGMDLDSTDLDMDN
ncbi:MAG: SPFH domain-containing protein [Tepidiformaceae bacterium]